MFEANGVSLNDAMRYDDGHTDSLVVSVVAHSTATAALFVTAAKHGWSHA